MLEITNQLYISWGGGFNILGGGGGGLILIHSICIHYRPAHIVLRVNLVTGNFFTCLERSGSVLRASSTQLSGRPWSGFLFAISFWTHKSFLLARARLINLNGCPFQAIPGV